MYSSKCETMSPFYNKGHSGSEGGETSPRVTPLVNMMRPGFELESVSKSVFPLDQMPSLGLKGLRAPGRMTRPRHQTCCGLLSKGVPKGLPVLSEEKEL